MGALRNKGKLTNLIISVRMVPCVEDSADHIVTTNLLKFVGTTPSGEDSADTIGASNSLISMGMSLLGNGLCGTQWDV